MSRRREYLSSMKVNLNSLDVNFIPVFESDTMAACRRNEALEILTNIIRLASKKGRNSGLNEEVFDESA